MPRLGLVIERQGIIPPSRFMLFAFSKEVLRRAAEGVMLAQTMPNHQRSDASLPFAWHVQNLDRIILSVQPSFAPVSPEVFVPAVATGTV